jgi:hypothetical protein
MAGIALALILSGVVIVRGALRGHTPLEAIRDVFDRSTGGEGLPPSVSIGSGAIDRVPGGDVITTPPGDMFPPNVERWRGLVAAHFPAQYVNQALSVMHCESRGNPEATNALSGAAGLFQHLPKYWADRAPKAGVIGPRNIYDPTANVQVAGWLFKQTNTWVHWSCKPSVP